MQDVAFSIHRQYDTKIRIWFALIESFAVLDIFEMQSKHGTIFRYRILILQLTMSSQIVGKRIEKEVLFNLDG